MKENNKNTDEDKALRTCQVYHKPQEKDQNRVLTLFIVIIVLAVLIFLLTTIL